MADKNISSLTAAATELDGTEKVHIVEGANSRRTTTRNIAAIGAAISTQAGTTYATVAGDQGTWVRLTNASPVTVTISDATHAAGDEITFEQAGAGAVTFAAGGALVLNSRGSRLTTNGQYAVASVKFISASVAILVGDLV
ncbi:MAG TPA: hypothetical protein VIG24_15530 [Acidimicrobiia bacterium]